VRYRLKLAAGQQEAAERVHRVHARSCPVYRTISGCVDISTELAMTIE
jgi:uncharacterized OsmC-like protein